MPETASDVIECPSCKALWASLEIYLSDPAVELVGYQLHFREQTSGFFLFNHHLCKTTMAVLAEEFLPLCNGPIFSECRSTGVRCPEYCLRGGANPDPSHLCDCEFVKEIEGVIRDWPKKNRECCFAKKGCR